MTTAAALPQPLEWPMAFSTAGPHIHSRHSHRQIIWSWTLAALLIAATGMILFGVDALRVVAFSVIAAVAAEALMTAAIHRRNPGGLAAAFLTGLLLALTLPPEVPWYVPCFGSGVAVILATWMFGGFGHHLWQPALVGRVMLQFLFAQHLSFAQTLTTSPILAPGHLLVGDLSATEPVAPGHYRGWDETPIPPRTEAFRVDRPVQTLRRLANGELPITGDAPLTTLIRDYLPPWDDTVFGTVPGGIGETSSLILIVVGLYLIYRGHLRWQVPVFALASAAFAAGVFPIVVSPAPGQPGVPRWLPALIVENGHAVGALYVAFHLTSGQLMLGSFLLAGDMLASPLTARGQTLFAVGIGLLTIFFRLYGMAEGECYWAILVMNTFVPMLDRRTSRRSAAETP